MPATACSALRAWTSRGPSTPSWSSTWARRSSSSPRRRPSRCPPMSPPLSSSGVLTLAGELGVEGREGRPVGTLFVIGDSDRVLAQSHQLVINPFHGYPEVERNILDPRLEETIKEFSAIDGAFIVRGDGVVLGGGPIPRPSRQARPSAAPRPGHPPRGRRQHHGHVAGPGHVHLAIDRYGLDLQGRPAGHRHPQAVGPHLRFAVSKSENRGFLAQRHRGERVAGRSAKAPTAPSSALRAPPPRPGLGGRRRKSGARLAPESAPGGAWRQKFAAAAARPCGS